MNVKLLIHIMPWELDYVLLTFDRLRRFKHYIPKDVTLHIESCLNLSDYIIDWNNSKIDRSFFVDKYKISLKLLDDWTVAKEKIIQGNRLYGHLDLERESISKDIDYYINMCPDIYFHETLIPNLIQSANLLDNKYFVITPQTYKMWDNTWDCLVHENYKDIPCELWDKGDVYDIENTINSISDVPFLQKNDTHKWAGWCDLYSKSYHEELVPSFDDWNGYGLRDTFGMIVTNFAKNNGVDFCQYILKNQIIFEYTTGKFKNENFTSIYKKLIKLNNIKNQRQHFEQNMEFYIKRWHIYAKTKGILE
jgi:hypothetical protein